jgi:tetratricopeptide (TPR) repeat protein
MANMFYAHLLTILRRTDEAIEYAEKAVRIDPLRPFILGLQEEVLRYAGHCDEAMQQSQKALAIDPDHFFAMGAHGAAAECLEDYETAYRIRRQQRLPLWDKYGVTGRFDEAFRDGGWRAFKREEIRVNNELFDPADQLDHVRLGYNYFTFGDYEKALDHWLSSAAAGLNPSLPYLSTFHYYNVLKENGRYIEFLELLNLPI